MPLATELFVTRQLVTTNPRPNPSEPSPNITNQETAPSSFTPNLGHNRAEVVYRQAGWRNQSHDAEAVEYVGDKLLVTAQPQFAIPPKLPVCSPCREVGGGTRHCSRNRASLVRFGHWCPRRCPP